MKLTTYSILLGFLMGLVFVTIYTNVVVVDDSKQSVLWLLAISEIIAISICYGGSRFVMNRQTGKVLTVRPLIYWPTIGLIAEFFTKGADLLSLSIWIAITLGAGAFAEWRRQKKCN